MIDSLALPKAELHLHIEGTFEPELIFAIAERNKIALSYSSVEALRAAYEFTDLQSFLDLYYAGMNVLRTEQDYYDLARAYFERAASQNVRHAEVFFDPQAHTDRGIPLAVVMEGLTQAVRDAEHELELSAHLIMCFLRDKSPQSAMATLEAALPYRDRIVAVGLDSAERDHPPVRFLTVFERARAEGFLTVAHAGEEGPPQYVWQALNLLKVARIDHGTRSLEDPRLVERLRRQRTPLTVCPLSNLRLRVVPSLSAHPLKDMLDAGIVATVNSDDPAYFGGYVNENYEQVARALRLTDADIIMLAKNSFEASFIDDVRKDYFINEIDEVVRDIRTKAQRAG